MSASEIAHFLKKYGDGDELTGVANVFLTGNLVGIGETVIASVALYSIYRLGKWGWRKINQHLSARETNNQLLLEEA